MSQVAFTDPTQQAVWEEHGPKNYRLGVINGILFIFAESLLDPTLVLVAFISQLTQSPFLIGLVVPLRDGMWSLPQLWVSSFLQSLPEKMGLYRRASIARIALWFSIAAVINFIREPQLQLVLFLVVFSISAFVSGLTGLSFLEVVSKTVPPRRRGAFFALRFGIGGVFAIFGSLLVRWMLSPASPLPFPSNFGLLAWLYFALASISLVLYNGVVEPPDPMLQPRVSFPAQVGRAFRVLRRDAAFRRFVILQTTLILAGSATPFFAVHVQRELGGPKEMVGVFLGVTMSMNLIGNYFFGQVSLRRGNRRVVALTCLSGVAMSALALAVVLLARPLGMTGQTASYALLPVYVLAGLRATGYGVGNTSLLLELAPAEERSVYVGFSNTFLGLALLSTGVSGLAYAALGLGGLLLITLGFHSLALWQAVRLGGVRGRARG